MRRGFGPWRLALPLLLATAATAGLLHVGQFEDDQRGLSRILEASVTAAARNRAAASRAASGTAPGFAELSATAAVLPALDRDLSAPFPARPLSLPPPSTADLRSAWREVAQRAGALGDLASQVQGLERDAQRLQSVATGLLVTSDELLDALIAAEARPRQLRVAARQLMLLQRISANLRRLISADAGLLSAADRLGRDAVAFGEVATGLFNGSEDLGLARVRDAESREILATVGREFRVLAQAVEDVVAAAAARAALSRRHEALLGALARVDQENERLRTGIAERAANRLITPIHVASLMALTALAVLAALLLALGDQRAAARVLREERASAQSSREELERERERLLREIELLGADIHRIADGDLGLRAHTDTGDAPGVGVARAGLDRLRQLLGRRREDALALAHSGQVVGDVAGRLREVARRQAHQVEDAGQATRVMAAALEALRQESAHVGEEARRSGASASAAGGALGETMHELDAVRAGVEDCAERVRALEDVARELRAVRTLVEDVGELGKMLSLNVAIQASVDSAASRALSAFSEEVQRLANRARSAVNQVEAIHAELRGEAERAASAVKESVWRARSAAERARGARGAVDEFSGAARRLEDLNHALERVQREHAVNVTDVVRAMTSLHAATREMRDQVDAAADAAGAFGEAASGLEHRLEAPPENDAIIEMSASEVSAPEEASETVEDEGDPALRALGRWQ